MNSLEKYSKLHLRKDAKPSLSGSLASGSENYFCTSEETGQFSTYWQSRFLPAALVPPEQEGFWSLKASSQVPVWDRMCLIAAPFAPHPPLWVLAGPNRLVRSVSAGCCAIRQPRRRYRLSKRLQAWRPGPAGDRSESESSAAGGEFDVSPQTCQLYTSSHKRSHNTNVAQKYFLLFALSEKNQLWPEKLTLGSFCCTTSFLMWEVEGKKQKKKPHSHYGKFVEHAHANYCG